MSVFFLFFVPPTLKSQSRGPKYEVIHHFWGPLLKNTPRTGQIVAKALDGQRYPLPLCEYILVCDGERGSGPEGADDLCLVSFEALGLNLSINNGI